MNISNEQALKYYKYELETKAELRTMRKALELEWNLDPRKIAIYTINTFQ